MGPKDQSFSRSQRYLKQPSLPISISVITEYNRGPRAKSSASKPTSNKRSPDPKPKETSQQITNRNNMLSKDSQDSGLFLGGATYSTHNSNQENNILVSQISYHNASEN